MATPFAERFPADYLAPGEDQWCARCGLLRLDLAPPSPVCARCDGSVPSAERRAAVARAHRRHEQLTAEREATAAARKAAGTPRLFWMEVARG